MTTATKSPASASGKGVSTETFEGKGNVTNTHSSSGTDASATFCQIGGNCETAQQSCATIEEKMKGCATMPDASAEWGTLKQCLQDCLTACQTACATLGVDYVPAPSVLCPV